MSLHELERILIGEIMLAQGGHRCLQSLCALGTRFPGTAGEELAQQYIMQKLQSYGLQPHLEEFEHLGWQRVSSRLELVTPVAQELLAVSLAGAPSTPEGGLEGEILFVGNGTPCDFDRYQDQIKGRIVLVSSLSPQGECSPPRQCHRRTKYGRAVAYGAAALLFMNSQPGMLPQVGSTRQNMEGEIPAVSIPYEEGQLLQYHLARGPVRVRLQTVNRSFPHKTGNIVAEIPGKRAQEVIIVGGHYDCHDNSHGAVDNGSGVAVLLELARIMQLLGGQLEKTIRFVFFGVEEMAAVGSSCYVNQHYDELGRVHLFLNLDGVGQQGGKTFDAQGFEDLGEYLEALGEEMGYRMTVSRPAFSGDALPFVLAGVPTLAMKRQGNHSLLGHQVLASSEDRGWGHTSADTIDKVQPHALYEAAIVAGRVLLRSASRSGPIAKTRSESEVDAILAQHGMEEVLAFMKWPTLPIGSRKQFH